MRWLGYSWLVAVNCFNLLVVLVVFAKLFERPEVVVVAILGLIYVTIQTRASHQNLGIARGLMALHRQVLEIRRLLKDAQFGEEAESLWKTEKALNDWTPNFYINGFFMGLISLMCLFVLGVKLLSG